ncbi:MAG: DNA-directed DNA polymerase [Candidatus Methanomethylophilaceae archaeon]
MGDWDVRLLSAYYRPEGDEVVIELFGKTRDGQSITIIDRGFHPYFHVVEPGSDIEEALKEDPEVLSLEHDQLYDRGEDREVLKVTIRFPWKVPDYRNRWKKKYRIVAADIPFHHRYIYDHDIHSCIRVYGSTVQADYATDLTVEMTAFENIDSFDPGLKVLSFDLENSIKNDTIYTICYTIGENGTLRPGDPIHGPEKDIIERFGEVIRQEDPDVISGYNIDNYDIPKIIERAKANRIQSLRWGRDNGEPRPVMDRFWRVRGRLVVDAWWAAKKELRPKRETLNAVSILVLGEQKLDVDPRRMDQEWADNPQRVMLYCQKDAELSLRILNAVESLRKGMDLATVSKLPVEDVLTSGSSQLIDSILIREADRHKVAVPMTGKFTRSEQIEGGYVHSIDAGLYHWVCTLDFKSMYPSLIIAKNICFTTLSPQGSNISPSGARFLAKEEKEGLLPRILKDLMSERDRVKKLMRDSQNEEERRYYNGLQEAVKILMNSFYGVFASSFYRFTDKSIGSSITSYARETVKGIISELQEEGLTVIYSDTDSIFIQSPYDNLDDTVAFGQELASRFSREGGQLEFEKIMEPLFSHGKKKRYVGNVVWPHTEMLIRGYEVRRTDSFDLQSEMMTRVFELILSEKEEEAVAYVRKEIQRTLEGDVDPEMLVISRSCKEFDSYKEPDSMANVQTAKKMIAMGYEFIPGMKVSWVVTNSKRTPQEVEPFIPGRSFDAKPDYRYYAERLAHTISRVTEVFGWSEEDLMLGSQQATLFNQDFQGRAPEPSPAPERKETKAMKKPSLLDFM